VAGAAIVVARNRSGRIVVLQEEYPDVWKGRNLLLCREIGLIL